MDEVEHAVEVGQRLSDAVAMERDAPATSGSSHVDSIARALMENIDNPPMRWKLPKVKDENSDEMMETESQKFQRYCQSELCEVSDPEAWMAIHHGTSQDESATEDDMDAT